MMLKEGYQKCAQRGVKISNETQRYKHAPLTDTEESLTLDSPLFSETYPGHL